ncbi:hypothetical protein ACIOJE_27840 [Kitasatospora sp. NPDC087861]|uniref:hypothetical protein n=1 Tax=Kitasatospora sp. NPDC087861 TaxID=3364070 RepID=UPI00381F0F8E
MTLTHILHQAVARTVQTLGPVGTLTLFVFVLLYVGVILPSIWSRHAYRRSAARTTMTTLLNHLTRLGHALRALLPW